MKLAAITLSAQGLKIAGILKKHIPAMDIYVHKDVRIIRGCLRFAAVMDLVAEIFERYDGLIFVAPCGVAVRAIAPHLRNKKKDPGVVVVDVLARYAVSVAGGHEGGANDLALRVSNILGAEPVISTTTEAVKTIIVGVGCRRNAKARSIIKAVNAALGMAGQKAGNVRYLASADIKRNEKGLIKAAGILRMPLRFIASAEIRNTRLDFKSSEFVREKTGLPAVAEPAALLAGRRTKLLLPRQVIESVTVAVAQESSL